MSSLRVAVAALGICGGGAVLYNKCVACRVPPEHNKELVRLAAVALSSEMIDTALIRDEHSLKLLRGFVKEVFLHPDVVESIKTRVKLEFTTNENTLAALKKFLVKDVISDTWVAEELISAAKEAGRDVIRDRTVHPNLTMPLVGCAAREGLQTPAFEEALRRALKASLWLAILGSPPDHIGKGRKK